MKPLAQVGLSRRELEVASLVAEGLTDAQIASRLFLSNRTAEGHVQAIRNKLGFDTRSQIAAWYVRRQAAEAHEATSDLPVQLTSFVGRTRELTDIRRLFERTRLLTISGPGGAGKTRLAIRAAEQRAEVVAAPVWFADLSAVVTGDGVLPAIAAATGVAEPQGGDLRAELVARLARARAEALLVVDNCEHVLEGSAAAVDTLLRAAPGLRILCTSREPLLADGEAILRLEALSLPPAAEPSSLDQVRRAESVQLFCDRAALSDPDFELVEANAATVAAICLELGGIPLALELAAAQVGPLSLEGVHSRLGERLDLLRRRSGPGRHQTLRATVTWSYELLSPAEQGLFRRLAVFRGGLFDDTARSVFDAEAELLPSLARKSLLAVEAHPDQPRWKLLESVRLHAEELLVESGEALDLRRRHLAAYLAVAERAEPGLAGPQQGAWLERLEADRANCAAALMPGPHGEPEQRLRLAVALHRFWLIRGHLGDGRARLEEALAEAPEPSLLRARALNAAAGLAWRQGDFGAARAGLEASLELHRRLDAPGARDLLANLGVLASSEGDYATAARHYQECLALDRARAAGDRASAILESNLGLALVELGRLEEARTHLEAGVAQLRRLSEPALVGSALVNLAILELREGAFPEARRLLAESVEILEEVGASPELASALEVLASLAALESRPELALRLAGAAARLRSEVRAPISPGALRRLEAALAPARESLGVRAERLFGEGTTLSPQAAAELSLSRSGSA